MEKAKDDDVKFPEAATLKRHMNTIADNIQGGGIVNRLASHLESKNVLTFHEKQKFTDPNNNHELLYTQKILDEVRRSIRRDENVFDEFLEIMKDIGGPAKTLAEQLEKGTAFSEHV